MTDEMIICLLNDIFGGGFVFCFSSFKLFELFCYPSRIQNMFNLLTEKTDYLLLSKSKIYSENFNDLFYDFKKDLYL